MLTYRDPRTGRTMAVAERETTRQAILTEAGWVVDAAPVAAPIPEPAPEPVLVADAAPAPDAAPKRKAGKAG